MTPLFVIAVGILGILQFTIPRRWSFVPLLVAACHLNNYEVLPELTACRLLIIFGLIRHLFDGSASRLKHHPIDTVFWLFMATAIVVSVSPRLDVPSPFKQNLGLIFNVAGTYYYGRLAFSFPSERLQDYALSLCLCLIPLAILLVIEREVRVNPYSALGTVSASVMERQGKSRAMGPFRHPILAGTLGATSFPLFFALWRNRRALAFIGIISCVLIVFGCNSSGPLAALWTSCVVLLLWPLHHRTKQIKWTLITVAVLLHAFSSRGIWYIMARMDLVGGSTGFHRAKLIDNALDDLGRWWLTGTDYTRNWMFSGVSWSERHTDITNYYLHLGVIGGMGLLVCLVAIIVVSFNSIGKSLNVIKTMAQATPSFRTAAFPLWCMAASLSAHAISFVSVSYFDQMYVLFYLLVAMISTLTYTEERASDPQGTHFTDNLLTG